MVNKRPLNKIAAAILTDWGPPETRLLRHTFAEPYVYAMLELRSITDMYGLDDAEQIVKRFLHNSAGWRGAVALEVKAELNAHLREKSC